MPEAREHPRTEQELRARDELMREQFQRDSEAWKEAAPLEGILARLKAIIASKK